jgi:hypothetical protein
VANSSRAVTVQGPEDVLADGSAFLFVEAEDYFELVGDETTGFIKVDKTNPIITATMTAAGDEIVKGGQTALPPDTNASGGVALLDQLGGGFHSNTAVWQVQFATPATYYLYMHYSFFNSDTNLTYSNEDSVFLPPTFNRNSSDGWIDYVGVDQDGNELIGDSVRDGWMPLFKEIVSMGTSESHNSTDEDFWDGQFHWSLMGVAVDVDANNAFIDDFGHKIEYKVAEADVGTVLTFEIASREHYSTIDGLLFSTSNELLQTYTQEQMDAFFLNRQMPVRGDFDGSGALDLPDVNMLNAAIASEMNEAKFSLNGDNAVNGADLSVWVKELRRTYFGDANLDGEFNSGDLVAVFTAGKYEQNTAATWDQGDWNADLRFDSGDMVVAFTEGGYEKGPLAASAVPEPSSGLLVMLGLALACRIRRRDTA